MTEHDRMEIDTQFFENQFKCIYFRDMEKDGTSKLMQFILNFIVSLFRKRRKKEIKEGVWG